MKTNTPTYQCKYHGQVGITKNELSEHKYCSPELEMKKKHTPIPWHHDPEVPRYVYANRDKGPCIAAMQYVNDSEEEAQANAAFIVTAVNSHEELLRACKAALDMLTNDRAIGVPLQAWLEAAIAKAEGGK